MIYILLPDKTEAEQLAERVEEASKILSEYNSRLEAELKERMEVQELLDSFIWQQKSMLREAKKKLKVSLVPTIWMRPSLSCLATAGNSFFLQEYQGKLERVTIVREELKSHLANLPDLSKLPMGAVGSLAPLPSVGDLFN